MRGHRSFRARKREVVGRRRPCVQAGDHLCRRSRSTRRKQRQLGRSRPESPCRVRHTEDDDAAAPRRSSRPTGTCQSGVGIKCSNGRDRQESIDAPVRTVGHRRRLVTHCLIGPSVVEHLFPDAPRIRSMCHPGARRSDMIRLTTASISIVLAAARIESLSAHGTPLGCKHGWEVLGTDSECVSMVGVRRRSFAQAGSRLIADIMRRDGPTDPATPPRSDDAMLPRPLRAPMPCMRTRSRGGSSRGRARPRCSAALRRKIVRV